MCSPRAPPRAADPAAAEPWPLAEDAELRVLATPAWRTRPGAADRLPELLKAWCASTTLATSACLYLLADPGVDGTPEQIEVRVLAACATAGADLDASADVTILLEPATADRDPRLHAATQVYVPLHAACAGHERLARTTGSDIIALAEMSASRMVPRDGHPPIETPFPPRASPAPETQEPSAGASMKNVIGGITLGA